DAASARTWFAREADSTDRGRPTFLSAQALTGLGSALIAMDDRAAAATVADRAVLLARDLGMPRVIADALTLQARLDADRAAELHHEALAIRVAHGLRAFYADNLDALAEVGVPSA